MRNDDLLASVTEVAGSKVLPPCVVYAKLGQGGMGAVYRARHLNLDIDVAVKVLKPRLIEEDPQFIARFRREGQSAARISHQNVIRVYDVAEHVGLHYIIMELVVGETARQRVERKGPLAVGEALQILYEAAQGLGEAHRLGFVHRDIKPDNLLISNTGQVKVADMGLAKPAIGGAQSMLSSANQIMGTPSYMPPEQWETTSVMATADVWALGATFWFLLAGKDAITDPERIPARIMQRILMQPFPDIRAVRSDLPDDVTALLAKATARDPGQRFLDAGEMVRAIDQIGIRRASLRDRDGGTTELHTLVSPPPVKNLEQIKRWLREDFQTRGQISRTGSKSTRTSSEREPEVERAPLLPVPVPAPPPRPASWRWRAGAALLLVAGGAAAYAVFAPDGAPPFAEADRLERAAEFAKALVEVDRVFDAKLAPRDEGRLVRLYRRQTAQLAAANDYAAALTCLATGVARIDLDADLVADRAQLRSRVRDAANRELQRDEPVGAVRRGERVRCRGKLALAAVQELRLAGTPVQRGTDGTFDQSIDPAGAEQIAITAALTDGFVVDLDPWRLDFAAAAAALTFTGNLEPVEPRIEGYAVTTKATIAVQGSLSQGGAKLFVGDREITGVRENNTGFQCELPVDQNGEQTVVVTARKDGFVDETSLRVVRLTSGPFVTIVAPTASTNEAVAEFVVTGDRWTREIQVTHRGEVTSLARDGASTTWKGRLRLAPGANRFTVQGIDLVGQKGVGKLFAVECTAKPASVLAALMVDDAQKPLASDGPTYVKSRDVTLDVTLDGTAPRLLLDGAAAQPGRIPLRDRLREGQAAELVLTPTNDFGNGEERRVRIVLDTQAPVVDVTAPAPGTKVPADSALKLEGTWRDASGVESLAVDGTAAKLTVDGNRGTFTVELTAPRADKSVAIRAVDRAGNVTATNVAIVVAATGAVAVKSFPGFRSEPQGANSLGYPKILTDEQTGIELVAIDLRSDVKPRLYAARRMTTEAQWGGGSSAPKTDVSGDDVEQWLAGRGAGLDLPSAAEWELIRGARGELQQVDSGPVEWLKPDRPAKKWPIRKDAGGREEWGSADSVAFGFRTVFRAP